MGANNRSQARDSVQIDIKEGRIKIEKGRVTVHSELPLPTVPPRRGIWQRPDPSGTPTATTEATRSIPVATSGAS